MGKVPRLRCPECGSVEINQYRMPMGPMWCMKCGFRVEDKNAVPNPFVEAAKASTDSSSKNKSAPEAGQKKSAG